MSTTPLRGDTLHAKNLRHSRVTSVDAKIVKGICIRSKRKSASPTLSWRPCQPRKKSSRLEGIQTLRCHFGMKKMTADNGALFILK